MIPATVCAPHSFTVSPSSAVCSAGWVSGIVAVVSMSDNTGPVRVVAVDSGVLMGAVSVRVACSGAGYETATVSVVLTARPPQQGCTTALGSLDARTTGGFTLTVATDIEDAPEPDPATVRGLVASYDAAVGVLFSVGFTYEPEAAVLSVVSVTPSGLAFTRRDVGNAVGLAGTPSLAGVYTVNLVLRQPGRVDTREFTVTATCRTGHTQQPDRSCEAPAPVVCTVSLGRGWVSSGTLVGSGSWEGGCVLPEGRMGRGGVFYAKHFMFSLLFDAVVTIDLTSSDENSYLFLLGGFGAHGDEVDRDNDSGTGRNSKLANLSLDAGAYTVSASTYHSERTGSFEVSLDAVLPLTITGLDYSYSATVGEEFLARFTYDPATAGLSVVWHTSGLDPTLEEDPAGEVTITDTITSAGAYAVLLAFAQPGRTVYKVFTITATCPTDQVTLPDGPCAAPLQELMQRDEFSLVPQPPGYPASSCYRTDLSDGSRVYTCRRIQEEPFYMSKTSRRILATSEPHATFGTMLAVESGEVLEGCQSITSDYWQCDYLADFIWTKRVGTTAASYFYPAFITGVVDPSRCAAAVVILWLNFLANPATFTSVVTQCEGLIVEEEE